MTFAALLCGAQAVAPACAAEGAGPLVFGVLNQQSPTKTAERWNPIISHLASKIGREVRLRMGATVGETDAMMGRGEFDLVFTNHNFMPRYDGQYRVIARWAGDPIHGAIVVRADSPLTTLAELHGRKLAVPSKDAFVAYVVPAAHLAARRIVAETVVAGTQDGAVAQLRAGQVDAAVVNSRYLAEYAANHQFAVRALYVSAAYAELPVIAHKRLDAKLVDAARAALLGMREDAAGAAALKAAAAPGFDPAVEADYANVREAYKAFED